MLSLVDLSKLIRRAPWQLNPGDDFNRGTFLDIWYHFIDLFDSSLFLLNSDFTSLPFTPHSDIDSETAKFGKR